MSKIAYKSIIEGNSDKCMESTVTAIKEELKLMNDQIISISIHDSKLRHGDLEAVVFYRTESIADNSEPTDSMSYNLIERDEDVNWSNMLEEILPLSNKSGKKCVSVCSTFRNVGDEKIIGNFYCDGK